MERNKYLYEAFPFLKEIDAGRRLEFERYFKSAPIWLLDACQIENVPAGYTFVTENSPVSTIYFIGKGSIRALDYSIDGITHEFMRFEHVYAMGGMEVIMNLQKYQTTLQTVTPCILVKLAKNKFEQWLAEDAKILRLEAQLIAEYLLQQARESRLYLFLQGSDRLAMLLANRYDRFAEKGILKVRGTRQDLSDATGLCVKTVNRAVKKLVTEGLLSQNGHDLYIDTEQYERLINMISHRANLKNLED